MSSPIYKRRLELWTQLDQAEVIEKLDELRHVGVLLETDKIHAVSQARRRGLSWEQIGRELNMTRQSAWERWHHLDAHDSGDPDNDHAAA